MIEQENPKKPKLIIGLGVLLLVVVVAVCVYFFRAAKKANSNSGGPCNGDGVCQQDENKNSCPVDCNVVS